MTGLDSPLRAILDGLPMAVFVLDREGRPFYANAAAVKLLGKGIDPQARPEDLADVYQAFVRETGAPYPRERMPIVRALEGRSSTVDDMVIRRQDRDVEIEVWGTPIRDQHGEIEFAAAAFLDISKRRLLERELARDALTALGSRAALREHLPETLSQLRRDNAGLVGVLFIDLDHFKRVNDRFGHAAGDCALVEVGRRITEVTRKRERPFRLGGDEFVVVCEDLARPEDATRIAERVEAAFRPHFVLEQGLVEIKTSIGIATTDDPDIDPEMLLLQADEAMYRTKATR